MAEHIKLMEQRAMGYDGSSDQFNRDTLKKLQEQEDLFGLFEMAFAKLQSNEVQSEISPFLTDFDKSIVLNNISMMEIARQVCLWNFLYEFVLSEDAETRKESGLVLEHLYKVKYTSLEDWGDSFAKALLEGNWTLQL